MMFYAKILQAQSTYSHNVLESFDENNDGHNKCNSNDSDYMDNGHANENSNDSDNNYVGDVRMKGIRVMTRKIG